MAALKKLQLHDFIAKNQAMFLAERKENLIPGEFIVIADFSLNYSFVVQDEVQSFHWNNLQATVHPSFATCTIRTLIENYKLFVPPSSLRIRNIILLLYTCSSAN